MINRQGWYFLRVKRCFFISVGVDSSIESDDINTNKNEIYHHQEKHIMKFLSLAALLMVSHLAVAEESLIIGLSIEETVKHSDDATASASKIEMGLNESVSLSVEGDYGVTIVSTANSDNKVNLLISLRDESNDGADLLGDKAITIKVGQSTSYKMTLNDHSYNVTIDTAYAPQPKVSDK